MTRSPRAPRGSGRLPLGALGLILLAALGPGSARAQGPGASVPERLSLEPSTVALRGGSDRQQIAVTGHSADGGVRDLTAEARFAIEPPDVAAVSAAGVVTPLRDGTARLRVSVAGLMLAADVVVSEAGRATPVSYRLDVAPLLSKAGCNMGPCHGNLSGKGGFRLSLRGDSPEFDWLALTHDAHGRRVDPARPEASLVLLKPTGGLPHEGGRRFAPDSPEATILRAWIAAGTPDDRDRAPALTRLSVWPTERLSAAPGRSQQLIVTAEFADGSRRDVTRAAAYDLSDPTAAVVSPEGRVVVQKPGELAVSVRYRDGRATSRLAFLPDRPDFAWPAIAARNRIDEALFARLRALRIRPSAPADDAVFLRRVYLDTIGVLPTPDEARAFLADPDPGKRDALIDRLLERPEFADFWALKWADLLRNEEKTMGPKGLWIFQRWLRDQIAADVPMDQFARALIRTQGSTWRNPASSFYRTNRDPQTCAETLGQVFLGVRLQCARCHNHPFDTWTQDDYYGLAAYFANVGRKSVNHDRKDSFDKHELTSDELVYRTGTRPPKLAHPRTGQLLDPKPPGGPAPTLAADDPDALDDLAEWLTRDNRQFARAMANRVWFHLLGRGLVEPVDDFRDSNPPAHPELLEALTDEFVRGGLRLRPLVRLILRSQAYQLGATPDPTNADDESHFARAAVRLLPAEVLRDAILTALEAPDRLERAPVGARTVQAAGVNVEGVPGKRGQAGGGFLRTFGKPERLLTCECERSEATTLAQAFQLINGDLVRGALEAPGNRIGRLLATAAPDDVILDDLYLAALGRFPAPAERDGALAHLAGAADRRRGWEDVAWALINSKEFLLRH